MTRHTFRHHPLLGTVVDVVIELVPPADTPPVVASGAEREAEAASRTAVAEIERLQDVFDIHRPTSELRRWLRTDLDRPGPELAEVLAMALDWQGRSDGRFNPLAGRLATRWRQAEDEDVAPTGSELAALARSVARSCYLMVDGRPVLVADGTGLDLNAIAKGYIVDRAVDTVVAHHRPLAVTIGAGGDVAHRGDRPARVAIENPLRPYDNEPPLTTIELVGGLATSGRSRRGFRIGGRWYAHVIDPRTGLTVDGTASISVIGPDAATADVVATAVGVLPAAAAVELVEAMPDVGCLVVEPDGRQWSDRMWREAEVGSDQRQDDQHE